MWVVKSRKLTDGRLADVNVRGGDMDYWKCNAAYRPWLVGIAAEHRGGVLDVGYGDGLLAQRLAAVSDSVTGIDPDPAPIACADDRPASLRNVTVYRQSFLDYQTGERALNQ